MAATRLRNSNKPEEVINEDRNPGVVYIGHVPHGFYEKQLLQYFSQFGKVLSVKLSRSKKNGKSKGYAFIKFKYAAVAKTVAETCHNYLFFNKLLKCEYRPLSEVHEDTFFNFKWQANNKSKRQHNNTKPESKLAKSLQASTAKQRRKLDKLKELGIDLQLEDIMNVPVVKPAEKKVKRSNSDSATEEIEVTSLGQKPLSPQTEKASVNAGKRYKKSVPQTESAPPTTEESIKTSVPSKEKAEAEAKEDISALKRKRVLTQGGRSIKPASMSNRKKAVIKRPNK